MRRLLERIRAMDRFSRNAGLLLGAEVFVRVKSLVLLPLVTRALEGSGYGAYSQVFVIVGLLTPVITLGTENGVIRFLPGTSVEEQRGRFLAWLRQLLIAGALGGVALIGLRGPISSIAFGARSSTFEDLTVLAAVSLFVAVMLAAARTWCRVRDDAKMLATITVLQAVWSGGIVAVLVAFGSPSPFALLATSIAGDAVLAVWVLGRAAGRHPRIDTTWSRRIIVYSLPLLPGAFAVWGVNALDRLFLIRYSTLAEVGRYSLAYSLAYLPIQVAVNPVWAMYPNVVAAHHNAGRADAVHSLFHRSTRAVIAFSAIAISISAVLGDAVIRILAPPEFARAAPVLPLVMAAYALLMLSAYSEVLLGLVGRQVWSTIGAGAALAVNTTLNVLLIPSHGAIGAAVATGCAGLVQLVVVSSVALRHRLPQLDILFALRCCAAALVTALGLAAARLVVNGGAPPVAIALGIVGLGAYVGALRVVRISPTELLRTRALSDDFDDDRAAETLTDPYGAGAAESSTIRP